LESLEDRAKRNFAFGPAALAAAIRRRASREDILGDDPPLQSGRVATARE
jgi:hypothetical protein